MSDLEAVLRVHVERGTVPGAAALVLRDGRPEEVAVVGHRDLAGEGVLTRDALWRLASVTKPVMAALVMTLVDDGSLALDDPVVRWLPELASARVVRTPSSPLGDTVPLARDITAEHLLTMTAGWGQAPGEDTPAGRELWDRRIETGTVWPDPRTPAQWLTDLAGVPLLARPGERWLYNTCSTIQSALVARVTGTPTGEALHARITGPLGMADTRFGVGAGEQHRLVDHVEADGGALVRVDDPPGAWDHEPLLPSGAGGLVGSLDDVATFLRMLAGRGTLDGASLLSEASVAAMTTDHLDDAQRRSAGFFLGGDDGGGWGYGGSVDRTTGEYGWVGGTGTAAYLVPSTGRVVVVMTQRALTGPDDFAVIRDVLAHAGATA